MNTEFEHDLGKLLARHNLGVLVSTESVSGGDINETYRLKTTEGQFFLKKNSAVRFPNMFEAEKRGLELISASDFIVPKPVLVGHVGNQQILILEWIERGSPRPEFWSVFGRNLAKMHSISNGSFGLDHDNYIGSLLQSNSEKETWADFYREERLIPQMKLAEKNGLLTSAMKRGFEALFVELENIFPTEKPSLLHGDLWSGNMMVVADGLPSIYDPAVYFGHREMDLAMMTLFGGFGNAWVETYNEVYPLESGWQERVPIEQLYPLLVHVNLFGGGYGSDVEHILKRF
ncbi:MAG: fructosamine kinase family protein [Flavobacteriales bacterium]|nr:fructosamine kinase family protein [Flavobacteriales bacterium]